MKIISGGQTGIDRAALDAAIEMGVEYGGWCPKGGWAEDFRKPPGLLARYPLLRETPSAEPIQRTEWNVRDADRLMILIDVSGIGVSKGTVAARDFALALDKPHSMIDLDAGDALAQALACAGKNASDASTIGIAGPRESEVPGIYAKARPFLCAVLARLARRSGDRGCA